jgi:hypothetical protein
MQSMDGSFTQALKYGLQLAASVLARDRLNLRPAAISLAAATRLRRDLRAVEAYVRRVLMLIALQFEHNLVVDNSERPRQIGPRKPSQKTLSIPIFERCVPRNDLFFEGDFKIKKRDFKTVNPAPLLDRLRALKDLLSAPEKRARRLALHMARRKEGMLLPPDPSGTAIRNRDGTEVSTIYKFMFQDIMERSRARPPPIGPRPWPPPRIRTL